jgi:hypothetical protein
MRSARTVSLLTYATGFAGTTAGTMLLVGDELALAIVVWALTFGTGGTLAAVGTLLRWAADQDLRTRQLMASIAADGRSDDRSGA